MKKVLLCILDGWGIGSKNKYNAIESAKKKKLRLSCKKIWLYKTPCF